jgi:hypothetical protein
VKPEDLQYLQRAGAGLHANLRIVDDQHVICCVGLLATLYFLHGDRPEVRERFAQALDRYRQAIGDKFVWGADPFTRETKRIAATDLANPRAWMNRVAPEDGVNLVMVGGREVRDADPHFARAAVRAFPPTELSFFSFGLPFEWIETHSPGAFVQLVVEVSNILAPTHGYAGLAAIGPIDLGRQSPEFATIAALIARFSGLEIDLPWSHSIYLEEEDRIKGINWLTILDHSWIERLGGEEAVKYELGAGIDWHSFQTGAVIQAGPRPLFGDRHRQEPMPHYRQVAKALKPIRIESVRSISTDYGLDRARSDKWLARFDDEP